MVAISLVFSLTGGVAWAYWSAGSDPGGNGASAATTVNQGTTPTASAVANAVTISWAASTLSDGTAVNGYVVKRYEFGTLIQHTILAACTGLITATTCVENAPTGQWVYTVTPQFATNWAGAESPVSNSVTVVPSESTPPVNVISRSLVSGSAVKSGSTIYYSGASAGSFTLSNALTDAGTGPASSATAALTGTTTGWTHTPSTIGTPIGGPYVSNQFSWVAGTTSAPSVVVTGSDVAGNTAATTLSFVEDSTAPSAGTVTYTNGYEAGLSVAVTFAAGTDGGSGLGAAQLQRASAPLTAGVCGTYSAFFNLGAANPTSPYTDSSVTNGVCYQYKYVVSDLVGNQDIATSANASKVDYSGAVNATTGLLSHWRLGETATTSDSFTGTTGDLLTTQHTGETGATWAYEIGSANTEQIEGNRARRVGTGYSVDYTTATPASADYNVEADLFVKTDLAGDMTGVIGRLVPTTNTFYTARWEQANGRWGLAKISNGTVTTLAFTGASALTVGATYRLRLSMIGTALKLYVNGVLTVSATDGAITAVGKAGIRDGLVGGTGSKSATAGIHYDNFQVTPTTVPRAVDSKGSNTGDYFNGTILGAARGLTGEANTAAQFDGVNDYVQATGTTGIPTGASVRSVEMWFKTSSASKQVLFAYGTLAANQEFGLWLNAGGSTMTAWGSSGSSVDNKVFTLGSAVNNGAWHQVVKTYDGTSITLYIDGVALTPQAATRATAMDSYGFALGSILNPSDATNTGFPFNGTLDEASLYTTTLSQTTVTNHYQLGTSPTPDTTGPTGGSVSATGLAGTGTLYSTSPTLSLALAKGTDPAGVSATGATLLRASATLTSAGTLNGACGTFGTYTLITDGTDPVSPKSDTVTAQACYRYHYVVSDGLGNTSTYTSQDIKVDTTPPAAPSLSFSTFTNTYWSSGTAVFYRSAAASGSFRATATATDTSSGILSYAFPTLGTNWTSTPVSTGVNTYSWSGAPAVPGTKNLTVTNNATGVSPVKAFTPTADDTAPSAGAVTYFNGTQSSTSVSVSFTTGTDAGSGLGSRLLQRASATLTGSTCGSYGAFSTRSTNPATSPYSDSVSGGNCYTYQYVVPDNVGNVATATSASVVKVDTSGPTGGSVAASGLVGTGPLYAATATLSLDLAKGTDPAGVATTGALLQRATSALTSTAGANGACAAFGTYTLISGGTDPATPKTDVVADQACYSYRYIVADLLGNSTTYTSASIKVDLTAPTAPSLTYGTFTNTYWSSGSTVFYRSAAASGSFRATASSTDTKSGILSYGFPGLGTNWTSTPVSLGVNTYSWSGAPASPGTQNITGTNNATGTSGGTAFTLTADDTAPTAGTVSYLNGATSSTSVSVTFTSGTDAASGIATATRLLQRASATLTAGVCGGFGAFATVTGGTNPTSPLANTVTTGNCYKYQYIVPDNVANQDTATSASVAKISSDVTGPTGGSVAASGLFGTGAVYAPALSLSLNLAKGTDPSGVATSGAQLQRATATLTSAGTADGTCGTFGTYTLITGGTDPASPITDTVFDQNCYSYRYIVADLLGNSTTYTSVGIKVDLTAPAAPSLTFGTFTNTYWSSGSTVFYRSAAASGSFVATAAGTDTASGILSTGYVFPASLGTNWSTSGTTSSRTYSWSGAPAAPGTQNVTATNNATGTSSAATFSLTSDDTAPSTSVTYTDGNTASTSVSVSFNATDAGSGVGTRLLQRSSATLTGATCGTFGAFATVTGGTNPTSPVTNAVTRGVCYKYQYVAPDNVGNSSTATSINVVKVMTYFNTISNTSGLLSYWRLNDAGTKYSYSFSESSGDELADKGSWNKIAGSDALYTGSSRIRKSGSPSLGSLYAAPSTPTTADYTVEADVYVASNLTNDVAGVTGRLSSSVSTGTFYGAVYDQPSTTWVLYRKVSGTVTVLGQSTAQPLTAASTYRLALAMNGSTIRLLVNGAQQVSAVDTAITATGYGGIVLGYGVANTTVTNSAGLHLDNFRTSPLMVDSKGTNAGAYLGTPTMAQAGAIVSDPDTAVLFDGASDTGSVASQISDDFSIEFWFKSSTGTGTGTGWWQGAGLVDAEGAVAAQDFGVSLRSDGKLVAGVGAPVAGQDVSVVSTTGGYNNNVWHHVVFARTRSSGEMQLYVDGVLKGAATGSTASLTSPPALDFGRILTGDKYFSGTMDEIAVYNIVLSGTAVTDHYAGGN